MKKICSMIVAILCVFILISCGSADDDARKVFVVELEGNPSTGYSWTYMMDKNGILQEDSYEYVEDQSDTVGAGGTFIFKFSGVSAGDVTLVFHMRGNGKTMNRSR